MLIAAAEVLRNAVFKRLCLTNIYNNPVFILHNIYSGCKRQAVCLTTSLAAKSDLWFHVKNLPGSHVIVFSHGGEVSDETILKAARLAALNSKAAASSNTAVDYTPVKYVKKPNGAKPGMVIYTANKTVYVTPDKGGLTE